MELLNIFCITNDILIIGYITDGKDNERTLEMSHADIPYRKPQIKER